MHGRYQSEGADCFLSCIGDGMKVDKGNTVQASMDAAVIPAASPKIIHCCLCGKTFEEHPSEPECLVGGHWTPHNSTDKPPKRLIHKCCHKYQKEIMEAAQL
jgi:hypothetical protein